MIILDSFINNTVEKKSCFWPSLLCSVLSVAACNDQDTGTRHKTQAHTKGTHKKPFAVLGASYDPTDSMCHPNNIPLRHF